MAPVSSKTGHRASAPDYTLWLSCLNPRAAGQCGQRQRVWRSPRLTHLRPGPQPQTDRAKADRAKAVVFGLGGIGLNVIQGLRLAGADMIIGVDLNNDKKEWGKRFGMTHFVTPSEGGDVVAEIVNMTKTPFDMTFAACLPPQAKTAKVPVLWSLSGLICTHGNAMGEQPWGVVAVKSD